MPPKTVVCSICGRTVNKRQTLLIGEGLRACHFHEETKKKSEELINWQKEEKRTNERRDKERKEGGMFSPESYKRHQDFIQNHCWCCCKKGIDIRELYYKMLVGMEKLKLKNKQIDFLNLPLQLKKEMNLLNVPTIVTLEVQDDILEHLHKLAHEVYSFTHTARLCVECLKKLKLFDKWQKSIPKPSIDQMLHIGAQYETSTLEKHVLKDAVDALEV